MTESNLFCWSTQYGDSLSKQQKDFRVFNFFVGKERYKEILELVKTILPNKQKLKLHEFWESLSDSQILELAKIPEFNAEGFEFITGRKVPCVDSEISAAIALLESKGIIVDGKILKLDNLPQILKFSPP